MNPDTLINVYSDTESFICPFSQFSKDNTDDPDLIADVACLARGFSFSIGGGAAPLYTIARWN